MFAVTTPPLSSSSPPSNPHSNAPTMFIHSYITCVSTEEVSHINQWHWPLVCVSVCVCVFAAAWCSVNRDWAWRSWTTRQDSQTPTPVLFESPLNSWVSPPNTASLCPHVPPKPPDPTLPPPHPPFFFFCKYMFTQCKWMVSTCSENRAFYSCENS